MNDLKTSDNELLVDTRPLFASAWLALFNVLRKNYNKRNPVVTANPEKLQAVGKKQSGLN